MTEAGVKVWKGQWADRRNGPPEPAAYRWTVWGLWEHTYLVSNVGSWPGAHVENSKTTPSRGASVNWGPGQVLCWAGSQEARWMLSVLAAAAVPPDTTFWAHGPHFTCAPALLSCFWGSSEQKHSSGGVSGERASHLTQEVVLPS